jgi:uncharacterized protein involved in exopolysaccharide biosynthesis
MEATRHGQVLPGGGEVGLDLKYYLAIFSRHLPYILILGLLGTALGGTVAVLSPPVYRAEARLVVEPEQIPGDLAASTVQVDASEQLEIIRQQILSRDILIDMASRLGIYEAEQGRAARRMTADEIVGDLRERIQIVTAGGAQGGGTPATILNVSFEAPTAQLASSVTNEVVTLILQRNVSMRTRTAGRRLTSSRRRSSASTRSWSSVATPCRLSRRRIATPYPRASSSAGASS